MKGQPNNERPDNHLLVGSAGVQKDSLVPGEWQDRDGHAAAYGIVCRGAWPYLHNGPAILRLGNHTYGG